MIYSQLGESSIAASALQLDASRSSFLHRKRSKNRVSVSSKSRLQTIIVAVQTH
jgi:hypothetical protein